VLSGRVIGAEEADRIGLVSRVVPAADLLSEATALADTIASKSLPSVYAAKTALDAAMETSLADGLAHEKVAFAELFDTIDQKEGMAAFREKRPPHFVHR
jgi:enoyl-CoA hydratase